MEAESDNRETKDSPGQNDISSTVNNTTNPPMDLVRELMFLSIILSAQLFPQWGVAMANVPLGIIAETFGDTDTAGWYVAGYTLTMGSFILIAGRLGDMFGYKPMFMLGFMWLALWSLIAGFARYASTSVFFNICRGLQGIGPAFMTPNGLAMLAQVYPSGPRKNMAFALFGAGAPVGYTVGALLSALLSQFAHWSWSFYLMAIMATVAAIVGHFVLPPISADQDTKCDGFDYLGAFTGVTGLVFFNVAWGQAHVVKWTRAYTYVLLILGVVFFGAYIVVEKYVAKRPLVPMTYCPTQTILTLASLSCGWMSFGVWIVYLYQTWALIKQYSTILTVGAISPITISGVIASIVTGLIMFRIPTWFVLNCSTIAFFIACILLATMPVHQTYWTQNFFSVIFEPWGIGMSFPAATLLVSEVVPSELQGVAASLVNTIVNYSIITGIGFAQTVQVYIMPNPATPEEIFRGIRAALYLGVGLSGLGVCISFVGTAHDIWVRRDRNYCTPKPPA
ncbi:low affinity ammonium transporter [Trichomonascus vanleenenianus]|uniref:MFS transporter n=1 Tax=Trichomonascus vanleenenianus TaxID=2268995 RepID=UPI003ECA8BFB